MGGLRGQRRVLRCAQDDKFFGTRRLEGGGYGDGCTWAGGWGTEAFEGSEGEAEATRKMDEDGGVSPRGTVAGFDEPPVMNDGGDSGEVDEAVQALPRACRRWHA